MTSAYHNLANNWGQSPLIFEKVFDLKFEIASSGEPYYYGQISYGIPPLTMVILILMQ